MPQINVVRDELFKYIKQEFSKYQIKQDNADHCYLYSLADEQFEDLCFEFGLEVEFGDGLEMNMARIDAQGNNVDLSKTRVYKVEVPANRYDLLCLEGIAQALRSYLGVDKQPQY